MRRYLDVAIEAPAPGPPVFGGLAATELLLSVSEEISCQTTAESSLQLASEAPKPSDGIGDVTEPAERTDFRTPQRTVHRFPNFGSL